MHDPKDLREIARKCRERAKSTMNPVVTEQLRRWATELAEAAHAIERTGCEPKEDAIDYLIEPSTRD
jgi:hypothetical protein